MSGAGDPEPSPDGSEERPAGVEPGVPPPGGPPLTWGRPEPSDGPTTYSRGWGDGARDALHYVSRLIARGHTPAEIRVFVESRLAHLDEEVSLKRKTLTSAPNGIPVESLVRVQPKGSGLRPAFPPVVPGYTYLFLEENRGVAREFLREVLPHTGRALAITRIPTDLRRLAPPSRLLLLHPGVETSSLEGVEPAEYTVSGLTGKVENFLARTPPPALLYVEAFEYLCTQNGFEIATRFAYWLHGRAQARQGILVMSMDPGAFSRAQIATVERDFNQVVKAT